MKNISEDQGIITIPGFSRKPVEQQLSLIDKMISRPDLHFIVVIDSVPVDLDFMIPHVTLCLNYSKEDPALLDQFIHYPCHHRELLLAPVDHVPDLTKVLNQGRIEKVSCAGDDSQTPVICHYDHLLSVRQQCISSHTAFCFLSTGTLFEKDRKVYRIPADHQHSQAQKAALDYYPKRKISRPHEELFARLSRSRFRSSFSLKQKDRDYIALKGMDTITQHARDMIAKRLAPAEIPNDGKQTPMKGHPVFLAQHATGTCCRGCLEKWHGIAPGTELTDSQQEYVVSVIIEWITRQLNQH